MKYFLLLLLISAAAAAPNIVGGRPTEITEVPWQLELDWNQLIWVFECGASIVGQTTAITAGHCVDGLRANQIRVRSGTTNRGEGTTHRASQVFQHPNYTVTPNGIPLNDIAILKFENPFEYSDSVKPVNITAAEPQAGDVVLISGWGTLREGGSAPTHLQSVEIPIVDRNECNEDYEGDITPDMICAGVPEGGKDSCQGDSGGPVVLNGNLVGIVSWGDGCARAGYPGVYTNVAYFLDWINQTVALLEKQ